MTPSSLVPSIAWLQAYRGEWLRPDIVAGLTAAAVVIPKLLGVYRAKSGFFRDLLAIVQRSKRARTLGRERMFFDVQAAVERFEQMPRTRPGEAI